MSADKSAYKITIIGAGITGLWQAFLLGKAGHKVRLVEASAEPFANAASRYGGAMLAPYCEEETSDELIRALGLGGVELWRAHFPQLSWHGSLVVAQARDQSELKRFARMTQGHRWLDEVELKSLEPDLEGRFSRALYYESEGHIAPERALELLLEALKELGVALEFGVEMKDDADADWVIDCRGMGAMADLPELRGVRGERALIRCGEISLARPVRLLHPRFPLYVVPWSEERYMIGATVIESIERFKMSLRSALELLGTAYALHPAFGEAEIVELSGDIRPAFPDNHPRIIEAGKRLYVNGLYRHGFLLAPILAEMVVNFLGDGEKDKDVFSSM